MNRCTVDDVLWWGPCPDYTPEVITEIFAGRESLSVAEILDLDIPPDDRLWAVLRPEMLSEEMLGELTCRFAEDVLPIYERKYPGDNRPRHAIEVKRQWLRGEATDDELAEALEGALSAWKAAEAAARAARATAWAAAWAAYASGATWAEAGERQVEIVREIVREVEVDDEQMHH